MLTTCIRNEDGLLVQDKQRKVPTVVEMGAENIMPCLLTEPEQVLCQCDRTFIKTSITIDRNLQAKLT